jgi:hypothetical protein
MFESSLEASRVYKDPDHVVFAHGTKGDFPTRFEGIIRWDAPNRLGDRGQKAQEAFNQP